jgi:hypothetical protein
MSHRVIEVDGMFRILNNRTGRTGSEKYLDKSDAESDANWEDSCVEEQAMESGMAFGIQAYNEIRGYDSYTPEPCGRCYHCGSDCSRCGDDY